MNSGFRKRVAAAFMAGYFISFLRNKLLSEERDEKDYQTLIIALVNKKILSTIGGLYKDIFDESLPVIKRTAETKELSCIIDQAFEMISEKIQRGGESFLEISFFCGGCLSLTECEQTDPIDLKKYESIIVSLFYHLNLNFPVDELKAILRNLNAFEIRSRRDSRDQLFFLICGKHTHHKQISDIQNLFESNYTYRSLIYS